MAPVFECNEDRGLLLFYGVTSLNYAQSLDSPKA